MNACPHRAIETTHSISILLWYLTWSLLPLAAMDCIVSEGWIDFTEKFWLSKLVSWALLWTISFGLVYMAYHLLHWGMRYHWVHRFVKATSFTSYKFWRRYKAPKGI
jgi:hypothetical protein